MVLKIIHVYFLLFLLFGHIHWCSGLTHSSVLRETFLVGFKEPYVALQIKSRSAVCKSRHLTCCTITSILLFMTEKAQFSCHCYQEVKHVMSDYHAATFTMKCLLPFARNSMSSVLSHSKMPGNKKKMTTKIVLFGMPCMTKLIEQ